MLLICEKVEDIKVLKETAESGKKNYFIEGVFLQSELKNRNGRLYPKSVVEREVIRYTKNNIANGRAYGELNHPDGPSINLDRVSHMIKELKEDGNNYVGKAKVMDTPMGNIVKNLIDEGANLGVSSRGVGSLKPNKEGIMEVQDDFMLATAADIVADPSAPDAFVRGVMENVEWWYDIAEGSWKAGKAQETSKSSMKKMTVQEINENKLKMFEHFLNSLVEK